MLRQSVASELSPEPILAAVEAFAGSFLDFETGIEVSATEFHAARTALSKLLAKRGVGFGDRVVVAVGNGPLFPTVLAAILSRAASPLLLHAKTPVAEMARYAERYQARLIVSDSASAADFLAGNLEPLLLDAAPWCQLVAANYRPTYNASAVANVILPGVPLHPTSGTTGQPKVALRPGAAAVAEAQHYIDTTGIDSSDRLLVVAPQSHAYCYGMGTMVPLLTSASVVTLKSFNATRVRDALQQGLVTVLPAAPAMLGSLMFGSAGDLFRGVHTIFSAGAPLNEKTADSFNRKFGVRVRPLYGTTETGGIAISAAGEQAVAGICVGPAMDGVEVEVRRMEDDFGPGVGMLYVRSESMMTGYLDEQGLDRSMLEGGWFKTGDLAQLDAQGRIYLQGRQSEVINVGGMKVVPNEVESVILTLPGVLEVKVYGSEHRSGTQTVKAAVVAPDVAEAALRAHCERHLVYYKRPDKLVLLDALPRNSAGKIAKDLLP